MTLEAGGIRRAHPGGKRYGALAAACLLVACSEPTKPAVHPVGPLTVRLISGFGATDTVGAYLTAPLVIEVRDSTGAPTGDTLVEFGTCCGVMVSGDTLPIDYSANAILRTDAAGRTRTYVQLGTTPESVYVSVHTLGDTNRVKASYLVLVGNLARIVIGIPDSAAYVGQGYRVSAHAGDRFANYRPDSLSYATSDSVLSVDSTGRLTALTIGRGAVVIRTGTIVDSAWVTVPPRGVIAAMDVQVGAGGAAGIVSFQLDGSNYRIIDSTATVAYAGSWPTWTPSAMPR